MRGSTLTPAGEGFTVEAGALWLPGWGCAMTDRHQYQTDVVRSRICCIECGRRADDARGWRAYLVEDVEDDTVAPEVAVYCAACALREFG